MGDPVLTPEVVVFADSLVEVERARAALKAAEAARDAAGKALAESHRCEIGFDFPAIRRDEITARRLARDVMSASTELPESDRAPLELFEGAPCAGSEMAR